MRKRRPDSYADMLKRWAKQRERIIRERVLGKSLAEIASMYGITRQRVGQIIKRAEQRE